jgi:hypothetical protein
LNDETRSCDSFPSISINARPDPYAFIQRMAQLASIGAGFVVESHSDHIGGDELNILNLYIAEDGDGAKSGVQLIATNREQKIQVESYLNRSPGTSHTRHSYVEFTRRSLCPLLKQYNKIFGTYHRLVCKKPSKQPLLTPHSELLFNRFSTLANTRSLHPLDWERYYLFIRNSRVEAPHGALQSLLIKKGFSINMARMLSDTYHHLWAFKKLR